MKREVLKSRAGCDRCKLRRKKCDEKRPSCGDCTRLNFFCTWASSLNKHKHRQVDNSELQYNVAESTEFLAIKRIPHSLLNSLKNCRVLDTGYKAFHDQAQFHFAVQTAALYAPLLSKSMSQENPNTSVLTTFALQHDTTRDAMAGYSAYVLYSSDLTNVNLKQEALRLYQRGLSTISKSLHAHKIDGNEISLLVAITFLGLMESLGTGDAEAAKPHFLASASICRSYRPQSTWSAAQYMLYRIAVECWLFNLASSAMYYRSCDKIIECVDWSVLNDAFGPPSTLDARTYATSPHMGGNQAVFRLMLQVTCFARLSHSITELTRQVSVWKAEIIDLEHCLPIYFNDLSESVAELYFVKYTLHIWALQIFLEKISCGSTTFINKRVRDARGLIGSKDILEYRNPSLAWPFTIFLLAANQEPEFTFFTSPDIYANFDSGHQKRVNQVIEQVRWCRGKGLQGLDLLLQKQGILDQETVQRCSSDYGSSDCSSDDNYKIETDTT